MPDVDSTLCHIAQWKYIIIIDHTKSFLPKTFGKRLIYPLSYEMPGSEASLWEIMCRALCHLLEEYYVAELADDL